MVDHHWAGIGSVRLPAGDIVPGFVRVVVSANNGQAGEIRGNFVPGGGDPGLLAGAEVEIILPRDVVGKATLGEPVRKIFPFRGAAPWEGWRALVEPPPLPNDRAQAIKRPGFLEIRAGVRVTSENWVTFEELGIKPGQRILMDYRGVMEILAPLHAFQEASRVIAELGLKVAMVGSGTLVLGINREASGEQRPQQNPNVRIFGDYDEARLWLLE
jgi:hypothetical protein